ncbi:MAG: nucleotidyl transferase AbiEii/AbiGii toxin family protein [Planctomycetes bacterium]|nr:nucleotidyl transferase AbiEii/AbiGii toxin family protein [Planctomycetota bacterium]
MSKKNPPNIAASVRQRLLNRIRQTGEDANLVWSRYAVERLLYRLSVSDYGRDFVLKGATLFMVWTGKLHRATLDVDLLGYGEDSSEHVQEVFCDVCRAEVEPDGLRFAPDTVTAAPIRGNQEYGGQRVTLTAFLGKARIPVQVDIGFGDVVTPKAEDVSYPTFLDFPAPRLRACTRETVIAEKLHAMMVLGIVNSRMRDFYDVYVLAQNFAFDGVMLSRAISATFERRSTALPAQLPLALTEQFGQNTAKQTQWRAFLRRSGVGNVSDKLAAVVASLAAFLGPVLNALAEHRPFSRKWQPSGPWQ